MLKKIRLTRYKAFEDFSLTLRGGTNVLVGPNNAGKSTIIAVLRVCSLLLKLAQRLNPSVSIEDNGRKVLAYPLALSKLQDLPGYTDENVHYEFREAEARIELETESNSKLTLVWPADSDSDPYFYFDYKPDMNARRRAQVAPHAPSIGVIPGLTPIEATEEVLTLKYVNEALGSRLTSRHFRNHLYHLHEEDEAEYTRTIEFMTDHTPEISKAFIRRRLSARLWELDFFFTETMAHSERELHWAGDGIQIWLQVLFHAFRQRSADTLVLDEPDVFLHPDMQRRLVNVLEDLGPQIVLATHAPEVIAEASKESVVLVDRSRRHARRIRDTAALDRLVSDLGSAFDLGLARALRSRVVLFVEGKDMKILRLLARAGGSLGVARERNQIAVVPLGGYSNWPIIEPFSWMKDHLLQDAVKMFVLLDRDYRQDDTCRKVVQELHSIGVTAHVWQRKELESYLLLAPLIARVSNVPLDECETLLSDTVDGMASQVESHMFSEIAKRNKGQDPGTVHTECREYFIQLWHDVDRRVSLVPPKEVISILNEKIRARGGNALSAHKLARAIRREELDDEVIDVLADIEQAQIGSACG